ncbi:MAG: ATP-binding protein [Chitinophagaceae bacterium]|nr:ATP-binding protein [Chitinophagaceae bacterium]
MSQYDLIKEITRYGIEGDQENLIGAVNQLITYSKNNKKLNFAIQLQSIVKEALSQQTGKLVKVGSPSYLNRMEDRDINELILEKVSSQYTLDNLVSSPAIKETLEHFFREHRSIALLQQYDLPVSNKILFHGPSGCGKTLASYVVAGELKKTMVVVNLGAIVSSKLGETSKNLAKIFKRAANEDCIIFIDEFDSLGKVRDYNQDHGEMKRVVNTILQLFDYLPQSSIVIAATNQVDMLDEALLRRFDLNVQFDLPSVQQIKTLIDITLKGNHFSFDKKTAVSGIIKLSLGLSYYSIQKTLITAIKDSLFRYKGKVASIARVIDTANWRKLVQREKTALMRKAKAKNPVRPRR